MGQKDARNDTAGVDQDPGLAAASTVTREKMKTMFTSQDFRDTHCGLGPCSFSWMQRLATKEVYMLSFCLVGIIQGMFYTYSISVVSTIEKRFKLTSKELGILLSGNDISQVMFALILGYYGTFGHRPRWLGVAVLCSAASSIFAFLPHLIYGPGTDALDLSVPSSSSSPVIADALGNITAATPDSAQEQLCQGTGSGNCNTDKGAEYTGVLVLFFLCQFFVGIAISIFASIGVTYLDDNVNKKSYPIYYTLTILLRILGPVLGFVIGGRCLSLWIDPSRRPVITKEDPRWLGAWWMGFLSLGVALAVMGLPLFLFPRKLPGTLRREAKRYLRQAARDPHQRGVHHFVALANTRKQTRKPNIKNLKEALRRIFTNKLWTANLFSSVIGLLALSGYWTFQPKYLETQFRKSAADASYYTGMASLVVSVVGAVISGAVMRWARPGPRLVTGYNIFVTLFSAASFFVFMFIGCPSLQVVGPIYGQTGPPCSAACNCSATYAPVCAHDLSTLYFSPCYAGCHVSNASVSPTVYSECQCVRGPPAADALATSMPLGSWGTATRGYCPESCNGFFYYFLVLIATKTIVATSRISGRVILLRSVAEEDKGIALGTEVMFLSLFAFIPAPIIMGAIIDSACVLWDESCGVSGNCWLYDALQFRIIIHLVPAVLMLVSVLGEIVMFRHSHKLDLYGYKDDQVDSEDDQPPLEDKVDLQEAESAPLKAQVKD